jgi:RNA polymerase sigma-70 factor (ECF subfamily)
MRLDSVPDWNMLYQQWLPRVYNFFRYRVTDRMVAEDLTSITFKRAWQSRDHYREDIAGFSTWLFTIARRVVADYFREHQVDDAPLDQARYLSSDETPEALTEQHELIELVRHLIQQLPEREQEVIALKYGAGMSQQQIGDLMDLSPSHVGVILHRAIIKLREHVKVNDELPQR